MAVEAWHLFPHHQLLGNSWDMMGTIEGNVASTASPYNLQTCYGLPLSGTTTVDTMAMLPMYGSPVMDSLPPRTPLKSDSTLSYNMPLPSRKRSRDLSSQILPCTMPRREMSCSSRFSFLGEDISLQIEQQQLDVDRFIARHMEKVRLEIEEKRKSHTRWIMEAVEERLVKRLRSKEEELDKMVKMNWALEERVKSLCVENQIWRGQAQTNEATANALRKNLDQVLAHVKDVAGDRNGRINDGGIDDNNHLPADDAESCCDNSTPEDNKVAAACVEPRGSGDRRWCRSCWKEEAQVLLLPCRHLCLCAVCGSSLHTCPVCKSAKTASVHVNVS
ncbi:hypothetical protein SAY87_032022 [Trapa incisa]|uniref:RING-type domain-containing protein n=1 Tax=Trapa incisa TaxID=236973 RepID=A0AAN7KX17_9MYRT|nr:hypothetical protein SAY87_032022 [Trapa incisa]